MCGRMGCTARRCPAIFSPSNGVLTCDAANLYGSRCSVACIPGYSVNGQPTQTECLPDQQWSNDVSPCRRELSDFVRLCNVRKVVFDPWVVTIGRLGRGVGAGDGDGHVYKGVACPWHMQGGGPSAILVTA